MQLVDLGCNLGVFTLYAAGMGRHVIAVDVLPSNLRLLQTSLTLNDLENQSYVIRRNTSDVYPKRNKDFGVDNVFIKDFNDAFSNKESLRETRQIKNRKTRVRKSRALLQLKTDHVTKREAISHKIPLPVKSGSEIADDKFRTGISANSNKTVIPDSHKRMETPASSWSNPRNMSSDAPPTETLRISQLVTIVQNAVYRDRTTRLGVHLQKDGNVGGSDVLREDSPLLDEQRKSQSLVLVDTICLDDLLPLVKAPSVYLKMDIEGSEPQALECAQKFFEKVRVRYVLMEWLFQLRAVGSLRPAAPAMIRFLTAKGLIPTRGTGVDVRGGAGDNRGVSVLDVNTWDKWPEVVLWMER
ncbi:unnamed protein product [Lymnaea stagnalis]|uniref:Methyltransferase FkbM domain-containing protein n=1 Tax=Lymnaea stagnalis TaxID=6523 RepID=A0AAV2IKE7_LYMST